MKQASRNLSAIDELLVIGPMLYAIAMGQKKNRQMHVLWRRLWNNYVNVMNVKYYTNDCL